MDITEVRVKLLPGRSDRLRAFCSITVDDEFVVHDLRVIDGRQGLFVAMPSRKLSDNCPRCAGKNHLRAKFCSECGAKLEESRSAVARGRDKLHVDVAHPINPACRELIQSTVLEAFLEEAARDEAGATPGRAYKRAQLDELAEELGAPEVEEPETTVQPEPEAERQVEPEAERQVEPEAERQVEPEAERQTEPEAETPREAEEERLEQPPPPKEEVVREAEEERREQPPRPKEEVAREGGGREQRKATGGFGDGIL